MPSICQRERCHASLSLLSSICPTCACQSLDTLKASLELSRPWCSPLKSFMHCTSLLHRTMLVTRHSFSRPCQTHTLSKEGSIPSSSSIAPQHPLFTLVWTSLEPSSSSSLSQASYIQSICIKSLQARDTPPSSTIKSSCPVVSHSSAVSFLTRLMAGGLSMKPIRHKLPSRYSRRLAIIASVMPWRESCPWGFKAAQRHCQSLTSEGTKPFNRRAIFGGESQIR